VLVSWCLMRWCLALSDTSLDGTPKSSVRGGAGILVDPSSTHFSSRGAVNTTLALHKMDKLVGEEAQGPKGVVESNIDASQNAKDKAESKTHDVSRQPAHTGHSSASAAGIEGGRARDMEASSAATGVGDDGDGSSNQVGSSGGVAASAEQDSSSAVVKKSPRQSHPKMRLRCGDNSSDEEQDAVFESSFRRQAERTGLPIHAVAGRGPTPAIPAGVGAAAANGKPVTISQKSSSSGFI
jgi:hypothetical protein